MEEKHADCRTCGCKDNGHNFYAERTTKYLDCKKCRNHKRKTLWIKNKKKNQQTIVEKGSFQIIFR